MQQSARPLRPCSTRLIRKSQTKDVCTVANDFVNMVQKIHSSVWTSETFEMLHQIANDPDSKWAHYAERLLRECDPHLLKTFLTAAAYEGGFRGFQQARANSEKYDCDIPWIVLMDPTSACNMHCTGCWAAEYGHKQNLTYEEMDRRSSTEGATSWAPTPASSPAASRMMRKTGHHPPVRKAPRHALFSRLHQRHAHRRGLLRRRCSRVRQLHRLAISIEGFEDANGRPPRPRDTLKRRSRAPWTSCTKTISRSAYPCCYTEQELQGRHAAMSIPTTCSSPRAATSPGTSTTCPSAWAPTTDLLLNPRAARAI